MTIFISFVIENMKPLEGIEPSIYALPRRRYTSKPQWHLWNWGIHLLIFNDSYFQAVKLLIPFPYFPLNEDPNVKLRCGCDSARIKNVDPGTYQKNISTEPRRDHDQDTYSK